MALESTDEVAGTKRARIAAQLRQRIVSGLHLGLFRPGDRLPSSRELSQELGADARVVLAAYRDLAAEGLVELHPRSGIYIAAAYGHPATQLPQLAAWSVGLLVQGIQYGVPAPELPDRLRRCLETPRLRAVCFECNDDQLHSLCEELRGDYGLESHGMLLGAGEAGHESASVLLRRADLFVTTTFHGDEIAALAAQYGKPWIAIALREEIMAGVSRRIVAEPVWFVGTDPRVATKLRRIFEPMGAGHNVRALIVGQDDLGRIPPNAPTVIFRRARPYVTDEALLARVPPVARVFAPSSAHEILAFIVHANLVAMQAREHGAVVRAP